MTIRTSRKTVTFSGPFVLNGVDETLPAGAYAVDTDEEPIEGISFLAYRRLSTWLHVGGKPGSRVLDRVIAIDPKDLNAALMRDEAPAKMLNEPHLDEMLADPLVRLVMCSDGLSENDVRQTLLRRLAPPGPETRFVA